MPNDTSTPQNAALISSDLKKMLVPIAITLVLSLGGSWFTTQQSQSEVRFQTVANKEQIAALIQADKAQSESINQIVISMARFSESQARIAADLKQLQDDQRANNAQMNRR